MKILITSPSLDPKRNISGISSVAGFIISNNPRHEYSHFKLGKEDDEPSAALLGRIPRCYLDWLLQMIGGSHDLIHFNFALSTKSVLRDSPLIAVARLLGKKMVIHVHGGEYLTGREAPLWMKLLLAPLFSGGNLKILLSNSEDEVVRRKFHARKTTVLQNCVDLRDAESVKRQSRDYQGIKLLFMGRISVSKGIEHILQALASLKGKCDFEFSLAGTGPDQEIWVRKFTDCLGNRFRYAGVVHGEAKREILRHCNVFLLPSLFEGLPMALLESMAYGLVPIVTEVGSIGEIIEDRRNGIVVGKSSPAGIASAILELSNAAGYMERLGRNARDYIFSSCKPADYILKLNRIYEDEYHRELPSRQQQ